MVEIAVVGPGRPFGLLGSMELDNYLERVDQFKPEDQMEISQ